MLHTSSLLFGVVGFFFGLKHVFFVMGILQEYTGTSVTVFHLQQLIMLMFLPFLLTVLLAT